MGSYIVCSVDVDFVNSQRVTHLLYVVQPGSVQQQQLTTRH